jgi:hypothetical protein
MESIDSTKETIGKHTPDMNVSNNGRSASGPQVSKSLQKFKSVMVVDENDSKADENEDDEKGGVFKRLAKVKARTFKDDKKKKTVLKDPEVNLFDNQYKVPILGITY